MTDEELAAFDPDELEEPAGDVEPSQINYFDRAVAIGFTQSGKSELINIPFSGFRCQRALVDYKREFALPEVSPVYDPDQLDWSQPLIHFRPHPGRGPEQFEEFFQAAMELTGPLVVACHEIGALINYRPQAAGPYLTAYFTQGAALGKGALMATQRPKNVPVFCLTEADHHFVTVPQLTRDDDLQTVADAMSPVNQDRFTKDDLSRELTSAISLHGRYSFLWKDRRSGVLQTFSPLPEHIRRMSIVKRTQSV